MIRKGGLTMGLYEAKDVRVLNSKIVDIQNISEKKMDEELKKGYDDMILANVTMANQVFENIKKKYDI